MGRIDVWGLVRGSKRLVCFEGRWQEQEEGSWHEVLEIKRVTGGFNEDSGYWICAFKSGHWVSLFIKGVKQSVKWTQGHCCRVHHPRASTASLLITSRNADVSGMIRKHHIPFSSCVISLQVLSHVQSRGSWFFSLKAETYTHTHTKQNKTHHCMFCPTGEEQCPP